jgi:signal transduction histidine kinase
LTRETVISVRWKMIMAFAGSVVVAAAGTFFLLLFAANVLSDLPLIRPTLGYLVRRGLAGPVTYVTGLLIFVTSFFLITAGMLRYISSISKAVNQMAGGNLDVRIPVRTNDEIGRLAGDINQMAARLKKSIEEEREAERAKNDLITSVSHDLRTPLTSILGYLELVDNDQYEDEVTLRHYVAIAHDKTRSLKGLIEDLFEFTRVNYRGLELNCKAVNLGRVLEQLAEEFVPILQRSNMEYRLNLPEHKVSVEADLSLLVRVFENIMSNAVRYGSDGRYVDIELVEDNGWAVTRIANYGAPIPESQINRIFDRFVRVEGSRSRDTGGAGLGLAIAKSIVDLHGGTIRAYNEGTRTVFEVKFRLSR